MSKAELHKWGSDHFYYINQLLGDQTLRGIIQENFQSSDGWNLMVEEGFGDGFHHYCGRGDEKWCSQCEGIQNLDDHPYDTLCHSYSMMKYMGLLTENDTKLTKGVQERMADMWKVIIENRNVQDQIIRSVKQKDTKDRKDPFLMKKIDPKLRNKKIIGEISTILDEWKEYGYKYYLLRK